MILSCSSACRLEYWGDWAKAKNSSTPVRQRSTVSFTRLIAQRSVKEIIKNHW